MNHEDTESRLHTRPSLLLRIRDSGDSEAWREFAGVYAPVIYGYCRRRGLQDADAADVTQEVLAQVAQSIRTFEYQPERGRFRGWLGAVTHSKIELLRRKARPEVQASGGPAPDGLLDEVGSAGEDPVWVEESSAALLRVALERIRPDFEPATWRAFEVVWLENHSPDDAAQETGLAVYSVYMAKSRVLKRLRQELLALAEDIPAFVPL